MFVFVLREGGWKHDIRIVQLQHTSESGVWLSARGSAEHRTEGGSGTSGEEIPGHGQSGAAGPHRTHQNTTAEEEERERRSKGLSDDRI